MPLFYCFAYSTVNKVSKSEKVFPRSHITTCWILTIYAEMFSVLLLFVCFSIIWSLNFLLIPFCPLLVMCVGCGGGWCLMSRRINCIDACDELPLLLLLPFHRLDHFTNTKKSFSPESPQSLSGVTRREKCFWWSMNIQLGETNIDEYNNLSRLIRGLAGRLLEGR